MGRTPRAARRFAVRICIGRHASDALGVLELPSISGKLVVVVELSHLIVGWPSGSRFGWGHVPEGSKVGANHARGTYSTTPESYPACKDRGTLASWAMRISLSLLRCLSLVVLTACARVPDTRAPAAAAPASATPGDPARLTVTADDGFTLTMWRKAPPEPRRAVLLVHGRTWSGRPDFDLQVAGEARSFMDALVAQGYAAYALDLRGYGATPRDATGFLTPARAAADVAAALRTIGDRPALFGWSRGSMVAQLTAQQHPELVAALILFGYPADPDRQPPAQPDADTPARNPTTAEAAAADFIAPGVISKRAIAAYVQAALAADPVRVDWRRETEWNALAPEAVRVPVLLLQAELDPYARTDAHARLFTRLGTADRQWIVIPKGDHAALLEDTAPRLIAAIRAFLDRP
jgi:pimeloyl-ACP methyl ester carboxylesterase